MGIKKPLGCLGIFVALTAGVVLLVYGFVFRPMMGAWNTLRDIHQVNERIENRDAYTPSEPGALDQSQVERFVAAQRRINERLEEKLTGLQNQYDDLRETWQDREPTLREMMTAGSDLLQLYAEAKTIQVDALNAQGFSLEEYRHVRRAFYQALGHELMPYNLDAIAAAVGEGQLDIDPSAFKVERGDVPDTIRERNRDLVAPYADTAHEWLVFSWWGL